MRYSRLSAAAAAAAAAASVVVVDVVDVDVDVVGVEEPTAWTTTIRSVDTLDT